MLSLKKIQTSLSKENYLLLSTQNRESRVTNELFFCEFFIAPIVPFFLLFLPIFAFHAYCIYFITHIAHFLLLNFWEETMLSVRAEVIVCKIYTLAFTHTIKPNVFSSKSKCIVYLNRFFDWKSSLLIILSF